MNTNNINYTEALVIAGIGAGIIIGMKNRYNLVATAVITLVLATAGGLVGNAIQN